MFRQQSHKQILDNLTSSVLLLDESLRIQYMNPAAEMLLEATLRRLKNRSIDEWLSSSEEEVRVLKESLRSGHPYSKRESRLVTQSGQELIVDYSVNPVPQSGLLLEIQARDRLIRIEREEEMLTRHATARTLVRGLAHEIKNPLGGIRGAAQLLERELTDDSLHEYTRIIIEEADRLRNLVDRLLGPHKLPNIEMVNIHAILERVCSLVQVESAGQIRLVRDYDPSIPEFEGDSEQLIQAMLNITRNAMEALQESNTPQPQILLRTRALRQITLGTERHRLVCSVEIIDNGPGIPADLLSSIFYPMVTGRADGSGLGLSIAQSIINSHHGLIECNTEPGQTRFQLFIPLEQNHENLR
ncbi:nitrogen regulation protein NR(II) [Marinobacterium sp. D7]|uniref:nitrogen regulation protein NR(II) n=1 Tax=Marinobacterium ramblicola TaxID=2849041 RepID=UPI001C2DD4AA|nr:nitrogen regulation protein NR(II) [Marinobacterium ramblicola]MBV1788768.1 nitrogen regulation protein NR(II) [Marinobacterium ramblicola]